MAIDRGPWNALIDDDGSNLVGSIWNKAAIKTVILDPADAAILAASVPTYGTWTPIDASGAGLTFTTIGCTYSKLDKIVTIQGHVQYPSTANSARARVGGLPFPNGAAYGGFYLVGSAQFLQLQMPPAEGAFYPNDGNTGAVKTNAQLTGLSFLFTGAYLMA